MVEIRELVHSVSSHSCCLHICLIGKHQSPNVSVSQAGLQPQPEEVYKCMSARGVGIRASVFYMEWAEFHELSGEARRAQEILEKGLAMLAEPREQLKTALK